MANIAQPGTQGFPSNPQREAILADACEQIMAGHTVAQIAAKHGIGCRTLELWLHQLGDEYTQLRAQWVDNLLMQAGEELEGADDALRIARARELWKRATWYAERRDARYRPQQVVQQDTTITVVLDPGAGRVLESYPQADRVTDGADPLDVVPMAELPNK